MGTVLIIPDVDYSDSNIGNITIIPPVGVLARKVATDYCEAIGDSSKYNAVHKLVYDLASRGLWEKMVAIYPMLGTTAEQLKVNLVDPGTFDLVWGERITIPEGGNRLYASTSDDTTPATIETVTKTFGDDFFAFNITKVSDVYKMDSCGSLSGSSTNAMALYYCKNHNSTADTGITALYGGNSTLFNQLEAYTNTYFYTAKNSVYASSFWAKGGSFGVSVDNEHFLEGTTSVSKSSFTISSRLSLGSKVTHYFKAYGLLTKTEGITVYNILKTFFETIKSDITIMVPTVTETTQS